ncbi:MAG: hypothetical protein HGA19_07180, partial [Oscillochloris sp.]|nr:hypothetical protein [Oscillochloris sp.]
RIPVNDEGLDHQWTFDATQISGFYRIQYGADTDSGPLFAANLDTRESDLALVDRGLLPSQFRETQAEPVVISARTGVQDQWPLFRLALLLVRDESGKIPPARTQQLFERLDNEFPQSIWTRQARPLHAYLQTIRIPRDKQREHGRSLHPRHQCTASPAWRCCTPRG